MRKICFKQFFAAALTVALGLGPCMFAFRGGQEERAVFGPARFSGAVVVIDAGHGGEDGGAVSVSGVAESQLTLAVAQRLDALLGLYGVETVMLREEDISLHDESAQTLREKKVSDLHNRVEIIESIENATLISIHQNTYPGADSHGAQVFYANGELSLPLAQVTQQTLRAVLDPENDRQPALIPDSVYLMNHITCRAILVECGFLSNPQEDALLQTPAYQCKVAAALAGAYLSDQKMQQEGESPIGIEGEDSVFLYGVRQ